MKSSRFRYLLLAVGAVFAFSAAATTAAQAAGGPVWQTTNWGVLKATSSRFAENTSVILPEQKEVFKLLAASGLNVECKTTESVEALLGGNPGTDVSQILFKECSIENDPECLATGLTPLKGAAGEIIVAVKTILVYTLGGKREDALVAFVPEGEGKEAGKNLFVELSFGAEEACGTAKNKSIDVLANGTEITEPEFNSRKCGVLAEMGKWNNAVSPSLFELAASGELVTDSALNFTSAPTNAELWLPTNAVFNEIKCELLAAEEPATLDGAALVETDPGEPFGWETA